MIYPRLKPQFDRRRKLMPDDIKKIRLLRKRGFSLEKIAKIFEVVPCTIFYWTNEQFRQWQIKNSSLNHLEMMKNDPEYRERQRLVRKDSMYHHLRCDPIGYRKYQSQQTIRWHRTPKGKALVKKINKTFREKHREELMLRCRNYYYANHDSILRKRRIKNRTPEEIKKRKDLWQRIKKDPIVLAEKNRKWNEWARKSGRYSKKIRKVARRKTGETTTRPRVLNDKLIT